MPKRSVAYKQVVLVFLGMAALAVPQVALATDYTHTGTASANWSVTTDWTPTAPTGGPNASGDIVRYQGNVSINTTQNTVGGVSVGQVTLQGANANSWTITPTTAITLNNSGSGATISNTNPNTGTGNSLILAAGTLTLADNLLVSNTGGNTNSAGSIQIASAIGGTGNLTLSNVSNSATSGQIVISGTNNFSGNTTITNGAVTYNDSNSFGGSANQINLGTTGAATLVSTVNSSILANNIVVGATSILGGNSNFGFNGAQYSGTITLNANVSLTSSAGGTGSVKFTNVISGSGGITTAGGGQILLNPSATNSFTGTTLISTSSILMLGANGALGSGTTGTSGITVSNSGTLLLTGSSAATDRINNNASVNLGSGSFPGTGGVFNTGGLNEGPAGGAAGSSAAMGALTLNSNSSIDFTAATGSNLLFSSLIYTSGTPVTITHWSGLANIDNGAATNDRLLFITDPGLTAAQLASIQFTNDASGSFAVGAREISFNGYTELVPVPEPGTWAAAVLAAAVSGCQLVRRKRRTVIG